MNLYFTIEVAPHIPDDNLVGELATAMRRALRLAAEQLTAQRPGLPLDEHTDRLASAAMQAAIGVMYEEGVKGGEPRGQIVKDVIEHAVDIVKHVRDYGDHTAPRTEALAP